MSSGKRSRASDPEQDPENGEEGSPDEDLGQGSKARRLRARRPTAKGSQSGSQKSVPLLQYLDGYDLSKYMNKFVEVRILPQSLTNSNHHVRGRHLWGTDVYTEDSDLVAVLQHTWYYVTTSTTPPPYISEVRAILKVVPGLKEGYSSSYRNGMRSRAWGRQEMKGDQGAAADTNSCAFEIEGCRVIKSSGQSVDLMPVENSALPIMPTFALAATEKLVITRASSQSGNRQQRCAQEVTLQYNLCNEPWMRYGVGVVADRGLKHSQWTSARLMKEVLYLETKTMRYELSRDEEGSSADKASLFKWSTCKVPLPLAQMRAKGLPLPGNQFSEVLSDLTFEDLQWANAGVYVKGKLYPILRLQFMARRKPAKQT